MTPWTSFGEGCSERGIPACSEWIPSKINFTSSLKVLEDPSRSCKDSFFLQFKESA
jgi:hypothetical protein